MAEATTSRVLRNDPVYTTVYLTTSVARVAADVIINKPGAPLVLFESILVVSSDHPGRTT